MDQIYDVEKAAVVEKLNTMGDEERMILLNKYTRRTEDIYCTFSADDNIDVIEKILLFKFSKNALVDSFMRGDPVVDYPGCRLNEFLKNEMTN
jgi:hypothetical protein